MSTEQEPIKPTCATCPYWEPHPRGKAFGSCRRHAPRAIAVVFDEDEDDDFAPVTADCWCGEHPDFPDYLAARKAASLPQEETRP